METECAQTVIHVHNSVGNTDATPGDLGEIKRQLAEVLELMRMIASDLAFLARK